MTEARTLGTLSRAQTEEMYALQNECFGDTRDYFDRLTAAAAGQTYLAVTQDGRLCAGMFLLDLDLFSGGKTYRGKYIFALGALESCRGRGYAKELLSEAKRLSADFTLLCAADEKLAAFYARQGFDCFVSGLVKPGGAGLPADTSAFCVCGGYTRVRQSLCLYGGVLLPKPLFELSLCECGAVPRFDGDRYAAVCGDRVFAAAGLALSGIPEKAQLYKKVDFDTDGLLADLLLEV